MCCHRELEPSGSAMRQGSNGGGMSKYIIRTRVSSKPRLRQQDGERRRQRQQADDEPHGAAVARLRLVPGRQACQQRSPEPALLTDPITC